MVFAALLSCVSCKGKSSGVRIIDRAPDAPGPTSQEATAEQKEKLYSNLVPLPRLLQGVAARTPDGEVWTKYPNGLMIHDLVPSAAQEALWGQTAKITYI